MVASLLLALSSAQEPPPPSTPDLVRIYLEGTSGDAARAEEALRSRAAAALPLLAEARRRRKDLPRPDALNDLLFDLKILATDLPGRSMAQHVRTVRVTVDMQNAPTSAILDYLREISGLNLTLEPASKAATKAVDLRLADVTLRAALETLCARTGLDFDFRWGVVLLAPPERLWPAAKEERLKPLTPDQSRQIRARIAELGSDSPETRDRAAAEIRKTGAPAIPILEEASRGRDAEIVARAKALIAELSPGAGGAFKPAGAWRSQKLEGSDLAIFRKLETLKFDLAFENTGSDDVLAFIRDFSEITVELKTPYPARAVTLKLKDISLGHCLELLTLPAGLDVRIEKGVVRLVARD